MWLSRATKGRSDDRNLRVSDEVRAAVDAGSARARAGVDDLHARTPPADATSRSRARPRSACAALGVVPATIGVVDGVPTVGLSPAEIERLSNADGVVKASLRDLPVAAVKGLSAGTTVAATAHLAHRAGVRVFSTGGLGGVHRGAQQTLRRVRGSRHPGGPPPRRGERRRQVDPRHPAHARAPRDAQPRRRRLPDDRLPRLLHRRLRPRHRVRGRTPPPRSPTIARARDALGISSTLLVANPVAADRELPPGRCTTRCSRAPSRPRTRRASSGHDTTPFLLDFIQRETGGRSLEVNIDVYRGNVALGAEIALALAAGR